MPTDIAFDTYARGVRTNAQSTAVLAARLAKAAPEDLSAHERRALARVRAAAGRVQEVQSERERLAPTKLRPLLAALVNDWSALQDALAAAARVPPDRGELGPRAARVLGSLLPEGVAFAQRSAPEAWSEAQRRLTRLRQEGLEPEVARLVGRHFVDGVKESTARLGDALGVGAVPQPAPSPSALLDALSEFTAAVAAYARVLAGAVLDETDPEQTRRFLAAVAPIDQHRAEQRAGSGEDDPEPAPPAPVPEAPPTPAGA
jgi:hypothetical protein